MAGGALGSRLLPGASVAPLLDPHSFAHYVEEFNRTYAEEVINLIPDARAWDWMTSNIPFFTCPDRQIEKLYYYRWWAFRKHLKQTPDGLLITEFLKPVKHAGPYNSLSCALGHHIAEARWLHDPSFANGDIHFWLRTGTNGGLRPNLHQFSGWVSATIWDKWLVDGRDSDLLPYLDALVLDYKKWEEERGLPNGLFWQRDVADGMEESISGGRHVKNVRPSINTYMYGNARAISLIAAKKGDRNLSAEYASKAASLKTKIEQYLWNPAAAFFETRLESGEFADVREEIGFTPWYFNLPADSRQYAQAWSQLRDPQGFEASFGLTTAERRNPKFKIARIGDDCQWNGPSWPFSTTITLKAFANLLNDYHAHSFKSEDYFAILQTYTHSQHLRLPSGKDVPWIDEDLDPFTGEWLARGIKIDEGTFYGRGDHYNHSGYCDLIITGLVGLRPASGSRFTVHPLLPAGTWPWFCLDRVLYHGRMLSILWDEKGDRFGRGKGLRVFADGAEIARSSDLGPVGVNLP